MPPPQTIVIKRPEAAAVYLPSPDVARLKMLPHITEVQRPTKIKNIIPTGTSAKPNDMSDLKTGILTITSVGIKMANSTSIIAMDDTVVSIVLLENFDPNIPPVSLPKSIRNQ